MYRLISLEAEISSERLRTGQIPQEVWLALPQKLARLAEAPLYIDDTPAITIYDLRAKCRRLKAEKGIGLVIDHSSAYGDGGTSQQSRSRRSPLSPAP